jgi:nitrous oxidase accessory protein NosD
MLTRFLFHLILMSAVPAAFAAVGYSQATRTWVSGVGDDVDPCSRTAPCKTFAGAISKTATGGEINCLDPAGYGAVTITKPITIDCTGTLGSILGAGTNGININLTDSGNTPAKVVRLRGLSINGAGTGMSGVRVIAAARVVIENVLIDGFTQNGITIMNKTPLQVSVHNSSIRNNIGAGIFGSPEGAADLVVSRCLIAGNGYGIWAAAGSTVRLSGNTIVHNVTGLSTVGTGKIISTKDNLIDGNGTNGAPTSTIALQ